MNHRFFSRLVGGLFIAALLICSGYAAIEPTKQGDKVNKKMVDAAKETLKATQAIHNVGQASVEDVYRWSQRVVEAEHFSKQSVQDHVALMRELHARAAAQNKIGAIGGEEQVLLATKYYLAEAEAGVEGELPE